MTTWSGDASLRLLACAQKLRISSARIVSAGRCPFLLRGSGAMPDFSPRISPAEAEQLVVGRKLGDAVRCADEAGFDVRVVRIDGTSRPQRRDLRPNRINVATESGVVVAVTGLG